MSLYSIDNDISFFKGLTENKIYYEGAKRRNFSFSEDIKKYSVLKSCSRIDCLPKYNSLYPDFSFCPIK